MAPQKSFVNLRHAKSGSYKKVLEKIEKSGKCPFCPGNLEFKNPILKKYGGWLVKMSDWPYKNAQHHFIFIPERHIENFSELIAKDFEAISYLVNWAIKEYKIEGSGFAMRFGDSKFTGATVKHLHAHLIVPEIDKKTGNAKVVDFPIG